MSGGWTVSSAIESKVSVKLAMASGLLWMSAVSLSSQRVCILSSVLHLKIPRMQPRLCTLNNIDLGNGYASSHVIDSYKYFF